MSILVALENALGRRAELSEYAEKVEHVVEDLTARVERLEGLAPASTPEPTAAPTGADAGQEATAPAATVPAEQGEPGQV